MYINFGQHPFFYQPESTVNTFEYFKKRDYLEERSEGGEASLGRSSLLPSDPLVMEEMIDTCWHWPPSQLNSKLIPNCFLPENDWLWAVEQDDSDIVEAIKELVESHPEKVSDLINIEDQYSRKAIDIATPKTRELLMSYIYFLNEYEINDDERFLHKSETCCVIKATRHGVAASKEMVVLKFMRNIDGFEREVSSHEELLKINENCSSVIPISFSYDDLSKLLPGSSRRPDFLKDYNHLLVLPACEKNLNEIMFSDNICGKDWNTIKNYFNQIVEAVSDLHKANVIHGDLKPLNIMRKRDGRMALIDLDASAKISDDYGSKFSSAYLCPEVIQLFFPNGNLKPLLTPLEQPKATIAIDMWALGCILYNLCTGESLWAYPNNTQDSIGDKQILESAAEWSSATKTSKLLKVIDRNARDLIAQLLHKEPNNRPSSVDHVLNHPFLSSAACVGRLSGDDPAKYDVFLSYRDDSDLKIATDLYDLLIRNRLDVFLDKICILPGTDWQREFLNGIVDCRIFVPILSKKGIKSRFEGLEEETSKIDNVFLEHRMALELKERNLITNIVPVFVGEKVSEIDDQIKIIDSYIEFNTKRKWNW